MDNICIETNEADIRGFRNLLMNYKMIFIICLMEDILAILNTLSLALQKQGILLVDIKHVIKIVIQKNERHE